MSVIGLFSDNSSNRERLSQQAKAHRKSLEGVSREFMSQNLAKVRFILYVSFVAKIADILCFSMYESIIGTGWLKANGYLV